MYRLHFKIVIPRMFWKSSRDSGDEALRRYLVHVFAGWNVPSRTFICFQPLYHLMDQSCPYPLNGVKGDRGYKGRKGEKGVTGKPGPPVPPSETCGGLGWRKVAVIDMSNARQNRPEGLTLIDYSKRSCGRTIEIQHYIHSLHSIHQSPLPLVGVNTVECVGELRLTVWVYIHEFLITMTHIISMHSTLMDQASLMGHPGHTFGHCNWLHQGISGDIII